MTDSFRKIEIGVDELGNLKISTSDGRKWRDLNDVISNQFRPDDIEDLSLWLDATQLELNDDDPISEWPDSSPNEYNAIQEMSERRPVKATNAEGFPVVRFDDALSPQSLSLTDEGLDLFRNLDACTVAAVFSPQNYKTDSPFNTRAYILSAAGSDGETQIVELDWDARASDYEWQTSNDNTIDRANYVIGQAGSSITTPAPQRGLIAIVATCDWMHGKIIGESGDLPWLSGACFSQVPGPTTDESSFAITIGGFLEGESEYGMTGDIAELIVYRRAFNARTRRELSEYLSNKWATL